MDAGFVGKGIPADNRLVALDLQAGCVARQAADWENCGVLMPGSNVQ